MASDVALALPPGEVAIDQPIIANEHDTSTRPPEAIQTLAFGEGNLLSATAASDDDPTGTEIKIDEDVEEDINEVVDHLVHRATASGTAVLVALGGDTFSDIKPYLSDAANLPPQEIRDAMSRISTPISQLVQRLVARADEAWEAVRQGHRGTVDEVIAVINPASLVGETLAGSVATKLFHSNTVKSRAAAAISTAPISIQQQRMRSIRRLDKLNRRWIDPVRVAARFITPLWGVMIGPVPAAPVAGVGMLAWVVLITGDHLDNNHLPDLFRGVVRRAGGE